MGDFVRYEKNDKVGIITIDRQEALNSLNQQVLSELNDALAVVEQDNDLAALIITGAGRAFVAGADVAAMSVMNLTEGRKFGQFGSAVFRRLEKLELPTIAAVNGFALGGGCELAMSCDMILASEKAQFGQPEVGLGIIPGFSGTQRLARRIGAARAKELIYTGKKIRAAEAAAMGLVNGVYPVEELMNAAMELAASIAKNAPIAVKYAKACIDRGLQMDIDDGIALENEMFAMCFATADQKEGMGAFVEKRAAEFTNS